MPETVTLLINRITLPAEDREKAMVGGAGYESLKASLKARGMLTPVFVDGRRKLVSGYYRLRAWAELGHKDVPVVYADNFDDVIRHTVGEDWYERVKEQKEVRPKEPKEQP